ncbi:MAG: class I SAM-dependent DNA methyltransferase [Acetivibrionales bacterium]|jgi:predicted TPR repeat methyltransferase
MYEGFAYIYDRLTRDIDYCRWADYIEEIFRINSQHPKLVLDMGCGTGTFCIEMAYRGYDMIGIDSSLDMLNCARQKTEKAGFDILYINQDMTGFELYGTVDAIVCLLDSFNYITRKSDLKKMLKLVRNYLNPDGLFIFDVNSLYKIRDILGNNVFFSVEDDITYIWDNKYKNDNSICEFDLTFFVKDGSNLYRRYDEIHRERAYSVEELTVLIGQSGMQLLNVYDDLSFLPPNDKSERIFFVCRK